MNPYESGQLEQKIDLDFAHRRAEKVLNENAIRMGEFGDIYNVGDDIAYVEEKEKQFALNNTSAQIEQKKRADILEAALLEEIELGNWLGEDTETIKTTKYDDIKNGIDAIVEFKEEERRAYHLGLALDVTFSIDVDKKLQRIKEGIANGKLPSIKYFKSSHMGFRGELSEIPEVVIGIDQQKTQEMTDAWINKDRKRLNGLPVKNIVLSEILLQLDSFKKFAARNKQPGIASRYGQVEKLVKSIVDEKNISPEYDRVLMSIESSLRNI